MGSNSDCVDPYTKELKQIVFDVYEKDFSLLGYIK